MVFKKEAAIPTLARAPMLAGDHEAEETLEPCHHLLNAGHGRSKVIEREVEDHRDAYRTHQRIMPV